MNFNIIEGNNDEELYDEFIKLYYDKSLKKQDICKKLDIGGSKYLRIKNALVEKGKIDGEFRSRSYNAKYYSKDKKRQVYTVIKTLNGKQVHFITVSTEEKAKFCVNLFQRYGWYEKNIPFVRARLMEVYGE